MGIISPYSSPAVQPTGAEQFFEQGAVKEADLSEPPLTALQSKPKNEMSESAVENPEELQAAQRQSQDSPQASGPSVSHGETHGGYPNEETFLQEVHRAEKSGVGLVGDVARSPGAVPGATAEHQTEQGKSGAVAAVKNLESRTPGSERGAPSSVFEFNLQRGAEGEAMDSSAPGLAEDPIKPACIQKGEAMDSSASALLGRGIKQCSEIFGYTIDDENKCAIQKPISAACLVVVSTTLEGGITSGGSVTAVLESGGSIVVKEGVSNGGKLDVTKTGPGMGPHVNIHGGVGKGGTVTARHLEKMEVNIHGDVSGEVTASGGPCYAMNVKGNVLSGGKVTNDGIWQDLTIHGSIEKGGEVRSPAKNENRIDVCGSVNAGAVVSVEGGGATGGKLIVLGDMRGDATVTGVKLWVKKNVEGNLKMSGKNCAFKSKGKVVGKGNIAVEGLDPLVADQATDPLVAGLDPLVADPETANQATESFLVKCEPPPAPPSGWPTKSETCPFGPMMDTNCPGGSPETADEGGSPETAAESQASATWPLLELVFIPVLLNLFLYC